MLGHQKRLKMSANFWPFLTINVHKKSRFWPFGVLRCPKFIVFGHFGAWLVSYPGAKTSGHAPLESLHRFVREKKNTVGVDFGHFLSGKHAA